MTAFLLITVFILVSMASGIPIAYCLGFAGIIGMLIETGLGPTASLLAQTIFDSSFSYELSVAPLFIAMGIMISRAKMSDKLFNAAGAFVGHQRGGMGMAAILSCGAFSAISGSSLATAATMSKASMPSMRRFGYADSLATGAIAAGGTLGILIPPSIVMIIYGIMTEQDISKMFIAGILPGIISIISYLITIRIITRIKPELGPPGQRVPWKERFGYLVQVIDIVILFCFVLGGIYLGLLASTEAAGIGSVIAIVLVGTRRKLSWKMIVKVMTETGRTTAMLFAIFTGAVFFTEFVNFSGLTDNMQEVIEVWEMSAVTVVIFFLVVCMLLGMIMDAMSIILLIVPIALPILVGLEVNIIWFGVLLVVATEISLVTPPVGMNVYVLQSVNPDVPLPVIFRGVLPFIAADLIRLALLIVFPAISLVFL